MPFHAHDTSGRLQQKMSMQNWGHIPYPTISQYGVWAISSLKARKNEFALIHISEVRMGFIAASRQDAVAEDVVAKAIRRRGRICQTNKPNGSM